MSTKKENKYTRLSWAERLMNPLYSNKEYKVKNIVLNLVKRVQVLSESLKRITYQNQYVPEDPCSNFSKYKVSDFSIENLRATGTLEKLSTTIIKGDKFVSIANMEKQFNSMSNSTKTE